MQTYTHTHKRRHIVTHTASHRNAGNSHVHSYAAQYKHTKRRELICVRDLRRIASHLMIHCEFIRHPKNNNKSTLALTQHIQTHTVQDDGDRGGGGGDDDREDDAGIRLHFRTRTTRSYVHETTQTNENKRVGRNGKRTTIGDRDVRN